MNTSHLQYNTLSLQDLAETLHLNYYDILAAMENQADLRLRNLKVADLHQTTCKYTILCEQVLICIQLLLNNRRQEVVPYLKELHGKEVSGHDCSTCKVAYSFTCWPAEQTLGYLCCDPRTIVSTTRRIYQQSI